MTTEAVHWFPSNFGQCRCRWCGAHALSPQARQSCPVTREHRQALLDFANQHGVQWKSLLKKWLRTTPALVSEPIREVVTIRGLRGLNGLTREMLDTVRHRFNNPEYARP